MAVALVVFNAVLFAGLASYALVTAARAPSRSVRWLWRLAAMPAIVVVVGGVHRIAIQLEVLLNEWQIVWSISVAIIGIAAFLGIRHLAGRLSELEWLVGEVLDRAQKVDLDVLQLTAREREVLDVIGTSSRIDDKTLAEKLSVSPGTIHTYVGTLLRKTKLRDRRDLAVVAFLLKSRHVRRLPHGGEASTPRR